MTQELQKRVTLAVEAAEAAGKLLLKVRNHLEIEAKGYGNWVTNADKEAEHIIRTAIKETFPNDVMYGEEGGGASAAELATKDHLWIVDPLDGTTNYLRGFDQFAVSLGYWQGSQPAIGVIYAPAKDELYLAIQGSGATLNREPIQVSETKVLAEALVGTGFPYEPDAHGYNNSDHAANFLARCPDIRRMGAAALDLASVAAGRLDGFWEFGLAAWDVAAGILLVQEAGGQVSGFRGEPLDILAERIVVSNGLIHEEMLQVLALGQTGL